MNLFVPLGKLLKPPTMNCSPTIAIALLLLSLTGGMFLLYKTRKESLGTFFKIVAWFIIVVSICSMICCSMLCMLRHCKQKCEKTEKCEMGSGGCENDGEECGMGNHGRFKRIMIFKDADGECQMMGKKGCCKEHMEGGEEKEGCGDEKEMSCCKKGGAHECGMEGEKKCDMKTEIKKDSVVVKKK